MDFGIAELDAGGLIPAGRVKRSLTILTREVMLAFKSEIAVAASRRRSTMLARRAPMKIDRYTKAVLTVIAVALVVIAVRPYVPASIWPATLQVAPAQAQTMAAREATIPKAWGKLVSYGSGNIYLEGPDKSLRIVDLDGKPPEYPKLKWIIKFE